ncbi:MAG TPA: hypothetical protein DER02_04215 [Gammaproteobacteria bacterium]|nr:hypothetical protein [Gammaproteobacteria bacterium]|tara:strand:- start:5996 stop:7120 length:1125 start_codon:yes stop_codon:yes gene_type:complete
MAWWKRFRPNKAVFRAALLATLVFAAGLIAIWFNSSSQQREMDRYGTSLASMLAKTTAGDLLAQERINLAIIGQSLISEPEILGVRFANNRGEILVENGQLGAASRYIANAALDDNAVGRITLYLDAQAFRPAFPWLRWIASFGLALASPFLAVSLLQISARGNRSLPIVSVPEEQATEQSAFLIILTLHNQLALSVQEREQALEDAKTIAQEVCALYPGMTLSLSERGTGLLLSKRDNQLEQAVYAAFLLQVLLDEYETLGRFRTLLTECVAPGDPTELVDIDPDELNLSLDLDDALTLASLARQQTVLVSAGLFDEPTDSDSYAKSNAFDHPLTQDISPDHALRLLTALLATQAQQIQAQAELILGFSNSER